MKIDRNGSRANKTILFDKSIKFKSIITSCGKILITTSLVTALFTNYTSDNFNVKPIKDFEINEQTITEENVSIKETNESEMVEEKNVTIVPIVIIEEPEIIVEEQISPEQQLIEEFCNAYNINSEIAYKIAIDKTNNFTDDEYLKTFNVKGTKLGGIERSYQTKEQGLLLFVRNLAQIPSTFGVTKEEIMNENIYENPNTYENITKRYSEIMGMDPSLVLAIMYNESAIFKSDMFLYMNNPGGLKNGNYFWNFKSKEEGIIETVITIYKLFYGKNYSIGEMGSIYCPEGTNEWINDVSYFYNQINNNPNEYFKEIKDREY